MQEGSFVYYIRISLTKRLILPLLFLASVLVIMTRIPLFDYFNISRVSGTAPLSRAVSNSVSYVRTDATDLYYTGNDYYLNGVLTGHYYYQLKDSYCRFYILEPSAGKPAEAYIPERTVTGKLTKFNEDTAPVLTSLSETLKWNTEGLQSICDLYLVNEVVYFPAAQRILFFFVILALIFGVVSIGYICLVLAFPTLSPALHRLSRYGNRQDILADAESELAENCIFRQNNMALTPKYLFEFSQDQSAIIPLESVLWVYRLQTMKYSLSLGRERMVYTMRIHTITGDKFTLKDKPGKALDTIHDVLTDRYPNFFYDYSEEHDKMVRYILSENKKEQKKNDRMRHKRGAH